MEHGTRLEPISISAPPNKAIVGIDAGQEIGVSLGGVGQVSSPYNFINNMNFAYSSDANNVVSGVWYPWHNNVLPFKLKDNSSYGRSYPFCTAAFLGGNYTSIRSITNNNCS